MVSCPPINGEHRARKWGGGIKRRGAFICHQDQGSLSMELCVTMETNRNWGSGGLTRPGQALGRTLMGCIRPVGNRACEEPRGQNLLG